MGLGSKQWECRDCGRKHHTDRKQCVNCGYTVLKPIDNEQRADRLSSILLALLPALLAAITMGLLAWVLFL